MSCVPSLPPPDSQTNCSAKFASLVFHILMLIAHEEEIEASEAEEVALAVDTSPAEGSSRLPR